MRLLLALSVALAVAASAARAAEVTIEDLVEGEGRAAAPGDRVSVHYDGRLVDGTRFDSSRERGQAFVFRLGEGRVIRGWEIGIQGMKEGGTRRLTIPPEYAYGSRDLGIIPPHSTLVFDVELLRIE